MKRFTKLTISTFYLFWIILENFSKVIFKPNSEGRLLILYYHSVPEEVKEKFIWQLDTLSKYGKFTHIDCCDDFQKNTRYYGMAIDDGLKSVFDNAVDELGKRNIPFTIFFPTAYIGKKPDWQEYGVKIRPGESIMDAVQIKNLGSEMIKIGSHTVNHSKLTLVSYEQQVLELTESKRYLEGILENEVTLFSFPYGDYNKDVIRIAKQANYKMVFSTEPKYSSCNKNKFIRGRVSVDPTDSRFEFIVKILGGYNWLSYYSFLKGKAKKMLKL